MLQLSSSRRGVSSYHPLCEEGGEQPSASTTRCFTWLIGRRNPSRTVPGISKCAAICVEQAALSEEFAPVLLRRPQITSVAQLLIPSLITLRSAV